MVKSSGSIFLRNFFGWIRLIRCQLRNNSTGGKGLNCSIIYFYLKACDTIYLVSSYFFPCTTIDMAEENRKSFLKQFLLKVKMNLFKFSYFSIFLLLKIFMLKS